MMSEGAIFDVLRAALWAGVVMSAPLLAVSLIVGLVIGLFQALTSIQENSLTFVPKLVCIVAVFWASMGFMTQTLVTLWRDTLVPMIAGA